MKIIIKNLEIEISKEELRALQDSAKEKDHKTEKPPLEEIFKEEIEAAKAKNKIKIGF